MLPAQFSQWKETFLEAEQRSLSKHAVALWLSFQYLVW